MAPLLGLAAPPAVSQTPPAHGAQEAVGYTGRCVLGVGGRLVGGGGRAYQPQPGRKAFPACRPQIHLHVFT